MGMYTEFVMASRIKQDTPESVLQLLKFMTKGNGELYTGKLPDHELFKTNRWTYMLNCSSCYFDGDTDSHLDFDEFRETHFLTIRCNFKNYDGELKKFLNWMMPYFDKLPGDFLGYSRYEEFEEPTFIYYEQPI